MSKNAHSNPEREGFAKRLRQARIAAGHVTMEAAARAAGIRSGVYWRHEKGKQGITFGVRDGWHSEISAERSSDHTRNRSEFGLLCVARAPRRFVAGLRPVDEVLQNALPLLKKQQTAARGGRGLDRP